MEVSESNRAQLATLQNAQSSNRSENVDSVQSQNAQEENQQQTLRANEGNNSVNISSEAQRLFANEQASESAAPARGDAPSSRSAGGESAAVEETVELQSGGTQSGKPR